MAIVIPAKGQADWDVTLNAALVELESEVTARATGAVLSTDKAVVRFSGTSGSVLLNSLALIADDGSISTPGNLNISGTTTVMGLQATGNFNLIGTAKAYRFRTDGSNLDLEASGVDLIVSNWSGANFTGTQHSYLRFSADAQNTQIAGKVEFVDALYGATKHTLDGAANQIGFYGATPASKPAVSGSRGGNAALTSLITALTTLGLITDNTTA